MWLGIVGAPRPPIPIYICTTPWCSPRWQFRHSGSPVRCGGCGRSGGDGGPFGAWATTAELERDADWADTVAPATRATEANPTAAFSVLIGPAQLAGTREPPAHSKGSTRSGRRSAAAAGA